jgi:hypothetical protein
MHVVHSLQRVSSKSLSRYEQQVGWEVLHTWATIIT